MYAELTYFDGYHFAHIAARQEHLRLSRSRAAGARATLQRRTTRHREKFDGKDD
jgi:hypothetical protein